MTFEEIDELVKRVNRERLKRGEEHYYRFLFHLACQMKPKLCLEIGVWLGDASSSMCDAEVHVAGIDITGTGFKHDRFHFIEGNSVKKTTINKVKKLVKKYGEIGIVYQDSSHYYIPSKKEWDAYSPLVAKGGVWVCDDITADFYNPNPNPNGDPDYQDPIGKGMVQYFEEIPMEKKKLYKDVLHKGNTQGIILF